MRKNSSILVLLGVSMVLVLLAGCSVHRPISQPSGTTLRLDMDSNSFTILGHGEGTACKSWFLGLPVSGKKTYQAAVEQAVRMRDGDLLIQASADETVTYFPSAFFSLYNQQSITVLIPTLFQPKFSD